MERAVTGIILAGGRATRLNGVNKALLEVGGRRIIDRVVDALSQVASQVVLVGHLTDEIKLPGVEVLHDAQPGAGTLAALHTGMMASRNPVCIVVGCDMPFLSPELLDQICQISCGHDVAVPRIGPHLEALHAAYALSCLPTIEHALSERQLKIIDFYRFVDTVEVPESYLRSIDPDLRSFLNVNTAEDLQKAKVLAEGPERKSETI